MTRVAELCEEIGWSGLELARRLKINDRTQRRWFDETNDAPPEVIAWLEGIASFLRRFPPPPPRKRPVEQPQ